MTLPPITAQIIPDLPPNVSELGTAGILGAVLIGVMWFVVRPLMTAYIATQKDKVDAQRELVAVNSELRDLVRDNRVVIERNTEQSKATEAGVSELAQSVAKLAETQSQLVKSLPDAIAQFVKASEAAVDRTIDTVNKANSLREGEILAGLARIEASVEALRGEIASGQKAQRAEVLGKIDKVLAELSTLKPLPPTPPAAMHLVPKAEGEAA